MSASWVTPLAPISPATRLTIVSETPMSAIGTVKLMSVWPSVEVFCTIMSTLTLRRRQRLEQRRRHAGLVGHAEHGDLGLADVGDDAGDDRVFHAQAPRR